jgi:phosphoglycerol transferase MdoB-like AlkP superfamily enzyme
MSRAALWSLARASTGRPALIRTLAFEPLWLLAALYLVVGLAVRAVLWWVFGRDAHVHVEQFIGGLVLGALNDMVEAAYLFLPLTLYLLLTPASWHRRPVGRAMMAAAMWLIVFGMLYVGTMEYYFFEEFDSRFNLVAVDYLIYPTEVLGDIRSEYPVVPLSLAIAVVSTALVYPLWQRVRHWPDAATLTVGARLRFAGCTAVLLSCAIALWPADRLDLFRNRVANELADNGAANFFAAFRTNHIDYHAFYRTGDPAKLRQLLMADLQRGGGEFVDPASGDLTRRFAARADGLGKLNVVLISEESLGAEYVSAYGAPGQLTPQFDALSKQGVLFTHAYSTGTRTVRGLEAFSASFPPIPSESIVKREGNADIATWGKVMRQLGYHTSFLYGGFGAFDNMNAYFGGNGFALSDRSDILHPRFANIWGVSDQDLFAHAIDYFDARAKENKPFFSIIMTTSNHKPFTFPAGIEGVKPSHGGRSAGARYADYALGEFIRQARSKPWFKDTIFVIAADHGARAYGRAEVPLYSYEIPLLILAPDRLAPRQVDTLTSQVDVAPTVLGLLGLPYQAPFFGQDVLHWPEQEPRSLLFNHNHDVALLQHGHLCILGLHQSAQCQHYERLPGAPGPATTRFAPIEDDDPLIDLATAYYQTAYDAFQSHHYR